MLVSYLPFRLAQKHYFQLCRKRGVTRGGPTQQYGVYFNRVRGTRDVRVIGSDCNCCVSLQITVHHSLSSPNSQPVSDPPFPSSACYPPCSYSRFCYVCPNLAASNGNTMLRIGAVCKRSIGGVTPPGRSRTCNGCR